MQNMNLLLARTRYACYRNLRCPRMLPLHLRAATAQQRLVCVPLRLRLWQTSPTRRSRRPCRISPEIVLHQLLKLPQINISLPRNLMTICPFHNKFSTSIFLVLTKSPIVQNLHDSPLNCFWIVGEALSDLPLSESSRSSWKGFR